MLGDSDPGGVIRWRGNVLSFDATGQAHILCDQVVEVLANGRFGSIRAPEAGEGVEHDHRNCLIAPGFIDVHAHYPQIDVIGSPAAGLLEWLEQHTFPCERRFADPAVAQDAARRFLGEMLRHGVTSAAVFCTAHPHSVDELMLEAERRAMALIAGKSLQDRNSLPGLQDNTENSLRDTEFLIGRWHRRGRLRYAITPRFAPTCTDRQLHGAAEIARAHPGVLVQSHVAESLSEIAWVRTLYPEDRSYLAVYDRFGLLRPHSIWGHCIHIDAEDRALLKAHGAVAAVCPTSNAFLGSGRFDFAQAGFAWALASDVGGGSSFSPFRTMLAAYETAQLGGVFLRPETLWWHHTGGAAQALGWDDCASGIAASRWADFVVLDPCATPLLERRWRLAESVGDQLFALIVLGDDRHVRQTVVAGTVQTPAPPVT
jgi:guanine deaminase